MTSLARLAVDTGGYFGERTNDLSLAYARAQRDLACVYSLGFYVDTEEDKRRGVTVRVKQPGLRAIHPSAYVYRSPAKKRESQLTAAWNAPEMYQTGVVRAHLYPTRPTSRKAWEGLLAVAIDLPPAEKEGDSVVRDFGAVLARSLSGGGQEVEYRFNRRVELRPVVGGMTSESRVTFLRHVALRPGDYIVTAVMADPDGTAPQSHTARIEVPEVPKEGLFLVGPMLGRQGGPNVVVMGDGAEADGDDRGGPRTLEPLLVQEAAVSTDLFVETRACLLGKKPKGSKKHPSAVERVLVRADGTEVAAYRSQPLVLEGKDGEPCQRILDMVPAGLLGTGEYAFEVRVTGAPGAAVERESIHFTIAKPGAS